MSNNFLLNYIEDFTILLNGIEIKKINYSPIFLIAVLETHFPGAQRASLCHHFESLDESGLGKVRKKETFVNQSKFWYKIQTPN